MTASTTRPKKRWHASLRASASAAAPRGAMADFAVDDAQKLIVNDAYTKRGAPGLAMT
jgi:hypothetical protein